MTIPAIETGLVSQRVISEEIEKIHAGAHAGETQPWLDFPPYRTGLGCVTRVYTDLAVFLIQPDGVVVRDLFGIDFGTLTTLLDVPLTDGTKKAAS